MRWDNISSPSEFILLGLSSRPEDQKPLFVLFVTIYLVTLMGNLIIILAIYSDIHLQTPMYFFLKSLSFVDICYTTVIIPPPGSLVPGILQARMLEWVAISFSNA